MANEPGTYLIDLEVVERRMGELGYNWKQVARQARLPPKTLYRWRNGARGNLASIALLAKALKTDTDRLIKKEIEKKQVGLSVSIALPPGLDPGLMSRVAAKFSELAEHLNSFNDEDDPDFQYHHDLWRLEHTDPETHEFFWIWIIFEVDHHYDEVTEALKQVLANPKTEWPDFVVFAAQGKGEPDEQTKKEFRRFGCDWDVIHRVDYLCTIDPNPKAWRIIYLRTRFATYGKDDVFKFLYYTLMQERHNFDWDLVKEALGEELFDEFAKWGADYCELRSRLRDEE